MSEPQWLSTDYFSVFFSREPRAAHGKIGETPELKCCVAAGERETCVTCLSGVLCGCSNLLAGVLKKSADVLQTQDEWWRHCGNCCCSTCVVMQDQGLNKKEIRKWYLRRCCIISDSCTPVTIWRCHRSAMPYWKLTLLNVATNTGLAHNETFAHSLQVNVIKTLLIFNTSICSSLLIIFCRARGVWSYPSMHCERGKTNTNSLKPLVNLLSPVHVTNAPTKQVDCMTLKCKRCVSVILTFDPMCAS